MLSRLRSPVNVNEESTKVSTFTEILDYQIMVSIYSDMCKPYPSHLSTSINPSHNGICYHHDRFKRVLFPQSLKSITDGTRTVKCKLQIKTFLGHFIHNTNILRLRVNPVFNKFLCTICLYTRVSLRSEKTKRRKTLMVFRERILLRGP